MVRVDFLFGVLDGRVSLGVFGAEVADGEAGWAVCVVVGRGTLLHGSVFWV